MHTLIKGCIRSRLKTVACIKLNKKPKIYIKFRPSFQAQTAKSWRHIRLPGLQLRQGRNGNLCLHKIVPWGDTAYPPLCFRSLSKIKLAFAVQYLRNKALCMKTFGPTTEYRYHGAVLQNYTQRNSSVISFYCFSRGMLEKPCALLRQEPPTVLWYSIHYLFIGTHQTSWTRGWEAGCHFWLFFRTSWTRIVSVC